MIRRKTKQNSKTNYGVEKEMPAFDIFPILIPLNQKTIRAIYSDPLGQCTVMTGNDHYFHTCPYDSPSPLFKIMHNKTSENIMVEPWVWPSGSLMTLTCFVRYNFGKTENGKI